MALWWRLALRARSLRRGDTVHEIPVGQPLFGYGRSRFSLVGVCFRRHALRPSRHRLPKTRSHKEPTRGRPYCLVGAHLDVLSFQALGYMTLERRSLPSQPPLRYCSQLRRDQIPQAVSRVIAA